MKLCMRQMLDKAGQTRQTEKAPFSVLRSPLTHCSKNLLFILTAFILVSLGACGDSGGNGITGPSIPSNVFTIRNTMEWEAAVTRVQNGGDEQSYVFNIADGGTPIEVTPQAGTTFGAVTGLELTLKGSGTLQLAANGNILNIGAGQSVTLDSASLTLKGLSQYEDDDENILGTNNTAALVRVAGNPGGVFTLKQGTIRDNTNTTGNGGGGVVVGGRGRFTMTGGFIKNNHGDTGGGVAVNGANSTFTMSGGFISGNSADFTGGGVYTYGGTTMTGGTIEGNSTPDNTGTGGGVYIYGGRFDMANGTIRDNKAKFGGGVGIRDYNITFTKTGGIIYGDTDRFHESGSDTNTATNSNPANTYGHAVYWSGKGYRNATLGQSDGISTTVPGSGWD